MNVPHRDLPRIVVIGCGFAGLKFVKNINTNYYQVVLFDKNNYHTFQPLMYQVASSGLEPDSIVYPIRKVFKHKENFHYRMAEVKEVDTDKKMVYTSIGELDYDYLIMATGAVTNFFGMKNMERYSMPMKTLVEALNLRSVVLQNFERAINADDMQERDALMNFVIVGGGATGVELAGALAELKRYILPKDYPDLDIRRMQIHIVQGADRLLPGMSSKASADAERFLRKLDVNVWLDVRAQDYDGSIVYTDDENFHTKTLIWTAGVKGAPSLGINAEKAGGNRIITNDKFQVKGFEEVFALGDVAAVLSEEKPEGYPMLASVAVQQGVRLAKNFNLLTRKKEMKPFVYSDKGSMATVGRNLAVVDTKTLKFGGLFAWFAWMFVHLMLLVDFRSRLIVFMNWAWSYFFYDKGTRLIVRKVEDKTALNTIQEEVEIKES
ncbi:MAG: NAD(P)/FAD-dependent oxidoreductase [Aureispira sp.]